MRNCVFVTIAAILLAGSMVFAQDKSKGRGNKPPGWQKGEKKGWKSDVPPGIEKKGDWLPPGLTAKGKIDKAPGRGPGRKEGWRGSETPPGEEDEKEKRKEEIEKAKAEKKEAKLEQKEAKVKRREAKAERKKAKRKKRE